MAVSAAQQAGQLRLYETGPDMMPRKAEKWQARTAGLCEGCRIREARYSFRTGWRAEHRTTLCFPCFRSELGRRQGALARRGGADGPGLATQARLPLADTLEALRTRRRHAQIAARHVLDGARHLEKPTVHEPQGVMTVADVARAVTP